MGNSRLPFLEAEAWLVSLTIGVGLRAGQFERLRRAAAYVVPTHHLTSGSPDAAVIARVEQAIVRAVPVLPGRCRTCLTRALAAQVMLGRRGIGSELRIGISRPGPELFTAHAWLVAHGCVVGEPPSDPDLVTLPLPSAR